MCLFRFPFKQLLALVWFPHFMWSCSCVNTPPQWSYNPHTRPACSTKSENVLMTSPLSPRISLTRPNNVLVRRRLTAFHPGPQTSTRAPDRFFLSLRPLEHGDDPREPVRAPALLQKPVLTLPLLPIPIHVLYVHFLKLWVLYSCTPSPRPRTRGTAVRQCFFSPLLAHQSVASSGFVMGHGKSRFTWDN